MYALEFQLKVSLDLLKNEATKEEGVIVQSLKAIKKSKRIKHKR